MSNENKPALTDDELNGMYSLRSGDDAPDSGGIVVTPGPLSGSDRVSWNMRHYYEQEGEDAVEVYSSGWTLADSKIVEPYQRSITLSRPGIRLPFDIGHVESPGMIFVHNTTKWRGPLTPTEEQTEAISKAGVIIRIGDEIAGILKPTQMQHFIGIDVLRVTLDCLTANPVRVKLVTFSR